MTVDLSIDEPIDPAVAAAAEIYLLLEARQQGRIRYLLEGGFPVQVMFKNLKRLWANRGISDSRVSAMVAAVFTLIYGGLVVGCVASILIAVGEISVPDKVTGSLIGPMSATLLFASFYMLTRPIEEYNRKRSPGDPSWEEKMRLTALLVAALTIGTIPGILGYPLLMLLTLFGLPLCVLGYIMWQQR